MSNLQVIILAIVQGLSEFLPISKRQRPRVKGAGGVKRKPPDGVPTDALDISDDGGLCKRVLTAGDPAEGTRASSS